MVVGGERMKNKLKLLLLPLIVFGLTACGTSKEGLEGAIEKTNSAKSYHMDYAIDMGIKSSGIEMEVPIKMGMDMDTKTKLAKMNMKMTMFGINVDINGYADLKNNIMYMENASEEDSWTKQELQNMSTQPIGKYSNATKKDSTKEEDHYQVTVTPEEFQKNLSLLGESGTTDGMNLTKDVTLDIYVNKKTNYISKMEADLKDAIELEEDVEYSKLKFTITFSEFNKVSVKEIDKSIIDKAVAAE